MYIFLARLWFIDELCVLIVVGLVLNFVCMFSCYNKVALVQMLVHLVILGLVSLLNCYIYAIRNRSSEMRTYFVRHLTHVQSNFL